MKSLTGFRSMLSDHVLARMRSRDALRMLLPGVLLGAIPLIHLGVPLLVGRLGPNWGWRDGYPAPVNLLGILAIFAGIGLLAWILSTMLLVARTLPPRIRFGLRPAQLVETGPYAVMRHPMYVAESCLWVGMIVLLGSPMVAAAFACVAKIAVTWVIPREEAALSEQFGDVYRSYRARVSFLPRLR